MDTSKFAEVLMKSDLFGPLPIDLLSKLASQSETISFAAGTEVISKGEDGDFLLIIAQGSVKVHDEGQVVAEFKQGDMVGELALLDRGPRTMTVTTLSDTDFLQIHRDTFYLLLKDRPDVLEKMIGILTQRLQNQNYRLVNSLRRREEELTQIVQERTQDLHERNKELKEALDQLGTTQQQLMLSEKMASLVQLSTGVAHEIQNPLNFVINFSAVAKDLIGEVRSEKDPIERERLLADLEVNIAKIHQHGIRVDATIKSMLLQGRTGTGEMQLTDVFDQISGMFRLAYKGFQIIQPNFNCRLNFVKDESLPKFNIVPQEFNRVILNLCNNAFYSMASKKTAMEKTGYKNYEPELSIKIDLQGSFVHIHIKDNGEGIPLNIQDKIFNPFFTTKPLGSGTGLGLSLSYDIITKIHQGRVSVVSAEGKGSEFIISIPV